LRALPKLPVQREKHFRRNSTTIQTKTFESKNTQIFENSTTVKKKHSPVSHHSTRAKHIHALKRAATGKNTHTCPLFEISRLAAVVVTL